MFTRSAVLGGGMPHGADCLAQGRALARDWQGGPSAFLTHHGVASEIAHKQAAMAEGRVMQHAQIGWRDPDLSVRGYREIWEACDRAGHRLDRYGLCLDWSMAVPRALRAQAQRGTGMILNRPEDFIRLANAAPVAAHFGDFVLGFPAAIENTQAALVAGAGAIGNLGQYFTFRVPGFDDDIEATRATVVALGLIAAQERPVLVHSNIDDGFAAQFTDVADALGMILIERDIAALCGVALGHAYGHHFSDPMVRMAMQRALVLAGAGVEAGAGTMVYGNTTSYRGTLAENWASLASYLMVDALAQRRHPSGHAINAVPVTENDRIPDIAEVIEAQVFAGRLIRQSAGWDGMVDAAAVDGVAHRLLGGAERFRQAVWAGLAEGGFDTSDPFEVLIALRRIGGRRLEAAFGAGVPDAAVAGGRVPVVPATILSEIAGMADAALSGATIPRGLAGMRVMVATSDVHEHGKMVIEEVLRRAGAVVLDGGVSVDPPALVARVLAEAPDAIAISTYNGVALAYFRSLRAGLAAAGLKVPVLIGGRLNQIPEGSNTSLPQDVGDVLSAEGAVVCRDAAGLLPALERVRHEAAT